MGEKTKPSITENTPRIETERLLLRRFRETDAQALFLILKDPEVNRFLPWFPMERQEEALLRLREFYLKSYEQPAGMRCAVCLKKDDVPIGYVHVSCDDSYDLGYGLRREFWGKGIMTEAAGAVVKRLRELGYPYITATHDVKNPGSGAVMRHIGMRYQYSYEEQWQPKNILVTFRMYQLNLDGQQERIYQKYWDQSAVHFVEPGLGGGWEKE